MGDPLFINIGSHKKIRGSFYIFIHIYTHLSVWTHNYASMSESVDICIHTPCTRCARRTVVWERMERGPCVVVCAMRCVMGMRAEGWVFVNDGRRVV